MTTKTSLESIAFAALPTVGADLDGGTFAGVITRKDGTHAAVILLSDLGEKLTWKKAMNWAAKLGGEPPSRPVAAMLFANIKAQLKPDWHWTSEEYDASRKTVNVALDRLQDMPAADLHQGANSYFGLLRQASHSHHDRTRVASLLLQRGHVVKGDFTKTYRRTVP